MATPERQRRVAVVVHSFSLVVYLVGVVMLIRRDGPFWGVALILLLIGFQITRLVLITRAKR